MADEQTKRDDVPSARARAIAAKLRHLRRLMAMSLAVALVLCAFFAPAESVPTIGFIALGVCLGLFGFLPYTPRYAKMRVAARAVAIAPVLLGVSAVRLTTAASARRGLTRPSFLRALVGFLKRFLSLPLALLDALIPLGLPVFAVLFFGSKTWGAGWELVLGLALLLFVLLTIELEQRAFGDAAGVLTKIWQRRRLALGLMLVLAALVAIYLVAYERKTIRVEAQFGGHAAPAGVFGATLFGLAVLFRFAGVLKSSVRLIAAVVVAAALVHFWLALGVGPDASAAADIKHDALILGGLVLAVVLIGASVETEMPDQAFLLKASLSRPAEVARALGLTLAIASSVLLALDVFSGMVAARDAEKPKIDVAAAPYPTLPGGRALSHLNDHDLAATYLPELAFTSGERWEATTVDSGLAQMILVPPRGTTAQGRDDVSF